MISDVTVNYVRYRVYEVGGALEDVDGWEKVVRESDVVVVVVDAFDPETKRMKKTRGLLEVVAKIVKEKGIPTVIIGNRMSEPDDAAVEAIAGPYLHGARTYHTAIRAVTDRKLGACMEWIESVSAFNSD